MLLDTLVLDRVLVCLSRTFQYGVVHGGSTAKEDAVLRIGCVPSFEARWNTD